MRWAENHDRVKMVIYYRGVDPDNDYNVQHYPGAPGPSPPPEQAAVGRVRARGHRAHRPGCTAEPGSNAAARPAPRRLSRAAAPG